MSWLARSLVNTLRGDDDEEPEPPPTTGPHQSSEDDDDDDPTRGVKEDLSELTKTLTRQFWGVASFLAPPPPENPNPNPNQPEPGSDEPNSPRLAGIRSDFAEIGGRFKTGISILSNTKAVAEISKIASTFLSAGLEDGDDAAVGVNDDVVAFAMNVSMHPETWLDFPVMDDDDSDDFDMSDAQQEHALAVERLAPRLAALRFELCPSHMSEGRFWKIYFVLLHSRLSKHDAELLMTPQIVQARAMLLQDLHYRTKSNSEGSGGGVYQKDVTSIPPDKNAISPSSEESGRGISESYEKDVTSIPPKENAILPNSEGSARGISESYERDVTSIPLEEKVISPSNTDSEMAPSGVHTSEEPTTSVPVTDFETEKHPVQTTEVKIIDKSVIEEGPPAQAKSTHFHSDASNIIPIQTYEEEGDDWLEEETAEAGGSGGTTVALVNEEDVSFSDLEEEDDDEKRKKSKTITRPEDSKDDWLSIEDIDTD